jgi:hypothetical protein
VWKNPPAVLAGWWGLARGPTCLPFFYATLPDDCLWGLLSGLLDGVGRLSTGLTPTRQVRISFCHLASHHEDMVQRYAHLLRLVGIRGRVSEQRRPTYSDYVLDLNHYDMARSAKHLHLLDPIKAASLNRMRSMDDVTDRVPIPTPVVDALSSMVANFRYRLTHPQLVREARSGRLLVKRTRALEWLAMLRKCEPTTPLLKEWAELLKADDIFFEQVTKVEPTRTQVMYDLTVPDTLVFAQADGWVIYDTVNFHVPSTDAAAKDVIDKLLPSRNLISEGDLQARLVPGQEFLIGLHLASRDPGKKPAKTFATRVDALAAFRRGELGLNDPVSIAGQ